MIDPPPLHAGNGTGRFRPDNLNAPMFRLYCYGMYTVTDIFANGSEVKAKERTIFEFDFVVLAARSRDDDSDPKPLSTWLSSRECPKTREREHSGHSTTHFRWHIRTFPVPCPAMQDRILPLTCLRVVPDCFPSHVIQIPGHSDPLMPFLDR
jgi:hypothetical protein